MGSVVLGLLLTGALAQAPPNAGEAKALPKDVALRLIAKAPAFAGNPGRAVQGVGLWMVLPGSEGGKAFIFEFRWSEKGVVHTGVAALARDVDLKDEHVKWIAQEGKWALSTILEDKTWDDVISGFKQSRIALNEPAAIGDIKTVLSLEAIFRNASGGFYGEWRCLSKPEDCIAGYQGPAFLESFRDPDAMGYRRSFHAGERKESGSPLLKSFAYTAVPLQPGESGQRGFCGDNTGRICFTPDGTAPLKDGLCAPSCQDLK